MELKDIKAIIDLMRRNDLSVFEMEKDGFKLKLQKGISEKTVLTPVATSVALPVAAAAPAAPVAASAPAAATQTPAQKAAEALKDIVSPMVGTFYRAGSPDSSFLRRYRQRSERRNSRVHHRGDESDERNQGRNKRGDCRSGGGKRKAGAIRAGPFPRALTGRDGSPSRPTRRARRSRPTISFHVRKNSDRESWRDCVARHSRLQGTRRSHARRLFGRRRRFASRAVSR